jgi:hypothetical protein
MKDAVGNGLERGDIDGVQEKMNYLLALGTNYLINRVSLELLESVVVVVEEIALEFD